MKKILKRYLIAILLLFINVILIFIYPEIGRKSFELSWQNLIEMLSIIPPIFILLGLIDVWVRKETMIKILGEKSNIIGILIAFVLGSAAAGPLYAAFPVAAMLMKKGSSFLNVLVFIGAWSTTKIPMLLFEASSMGLKFMLLRLALNIPVILLIALISVKVLRKKDIDEIYVLAENMD
ncbi:MAG: permease [Eubacteriales bacterium]